MTLRAWRETWMCLAASTLGGVTDAAADPAVSVYDAAPLASATYVVRATHDPDPFNDSGPVFVVERGAYKCSPLLHALHVQNGTVGAADLAAGRKTCELSLALGMDDDLYGTGKGDDAEAMVVVDANGKLLTTPAAILAAAQPIDSPAKALLAVWLTKQYTVSWYVPPAKGTKPDPDEPPSARFHGGLEDGHVRKVAAGFEVDGAMVESSCKEAKNEKTVTTWRITLRVDAQGKITVKSKTVVDTSKQMCVVQFGRRPADFVEVDAADTVRDQLRRAWHHEAESVRAFERIARELAAHGAPGELVEAARAAAAQERDHAARCAALVGEIEAAVADDALPVRDLVALAIDNAREGCVGESFAALANVVQARAAATPELRAHFAAIAADELAHAALAHAIAAWLDGRLGPADRAVVSAVRAHAIAELRASFGTPTEADRVLGRPTGADAARLLAMVASA